MSDLITVGWRMLAFLVILYALLAVAAHFLSLSMIFPRPPLKYAAGPDYVELTGIDGVKLAGRYWPNPGAKYTLLYLHGNYEDLGSLAEYLPQYVKEGGVAAFAIDYHGYGLSGGRSTEASAYADAQLAYEYVRHTLKVPADRIILFGYSLGGGPAVELALHRPAAGLVLQGAFTSAYRVMTRVP